MELVVTLLNGIRDVLTIQVDLPEPATTGEQQDLLTDAVNNPGLFDSQLYLFETVGILSSLTFKDPTQTEAILLSIVRPLIDELSVSLRTNVNDTEDLVPVVKAHHIIMALGNIAKGFPDFPSPIPAEYIMPPVDVFRQMAQAIIVSLEAMNVYKVVRDAVRVVLLCHSLCSYTVTS